MSQFEKHVYSNVTFGDIIKEIHENSKAKAVDLNAMIRELRALITNPQDAMLIVPLIAEYFGKGIQNDDALVRMASIIQRAITRDQAVEPTSVELFSEAEWEQLQGYSEQINQPIPELPETIKLDASKNME